MSMRVYDLGHARAGDKGNTSNISVTAYNDEGWQVLRRELTSERVLAHFGHLTPGPVHRYELPQLRALNFVIENALGGGVTRSLAIDPHGKSLSALMLTITLPGHNEGPLVSQAALPASTSPNSSQVLPVQRIS